jgi:hypothetical protein
MKINMKINKIIGALCLAVCLLIQDKRSGNVAIIKLGYQADNEAVREILCSAIQNGAFYNEGIHLELYVYEDEAALDEDFILGKYEVVCSGNLEELMIGEDECMLKVIFEACVNEESRMSVSVMEDVLEAKTDVLLRLLKGFNIECESNQRIRSIGADEWMSYYQNYGISEEKLLEYMAFDFFDEALDK